MVNRIILEEIDKYINSIIFENSVLLEKKKKKSDKKKKKSNKKKEKDVWKGALKAVGGFRKDYNRKLDVKTNPNLNKSDEDSITNILDSDAINLAAVARLVYPNLTRAGAQSKLRKKVKGEKSDSGSVYKIKKKEANRIDRVLSDLL